MKRNNLAPYIRSVLMFFVMTAVTAASAHEYYLQPDKYAADLGEEFSVDHKNGMRFKGNTYPWITKWNIRSEAWQNGVGVKVFGKDGDRPALSLKSDKPGLISIIHQSDESQLTFRKWEKFRSYLAEEGLDEIAKRHEELGYPKDRIKEIYTRFAKTLINVGDATEPETPAGLKIELVALTNPSVLKRGEPLPVQVLYEGKPLDGSMVKVFAGMDTEAAPLIKANEQGKVEIPDSGTGPYLLNVVHMTKPQSKSVSAKDAHWESFWASMTFERP